MGLPCDGLCPVCAVASSAAVQTCDPVGPLAEI
eukprot:CAMPEP_0174372898 /NCGR_PEP_ID=MMETSP0811_2-20130205/105082_1 /TAXON_ID=73025 ORGANISM="Eutreptiella gymnastica-like, Strain CCMP1594" /NCGR_SAMPLE_ID=MMETSP0811_2 /ASSEMBLY_ACC=CAM_ASM_000667 /LENGTH=32 /DNA_ID= /DNA_START= /DNA_END= /DNA_ORIENTATION=